MINIKKTTTLFLFFALIILGLLLGEMATYFLDINSLIYKDLSEQLSLSQLEVFFENKAQWSWVGYAIMPIILFIKITLIAWILGMGGFFYDVRLSHHKYFRAVLLSEFIFLLPAIIKIVWFYFFETDFTLLEVQQFVPLSLQSIIDTSNIPDWALYPLQIINVFEVAYWLALAFFLNKFLEMAKGMKVVLAGYAPALFVWIIFIMFLTLNMSS